MRWGKTNERVVYTTKVVVFVVNDNNPPQPRFFSFTLFLCEFLYLWLMVGLIFLN